MSPWSRSDSVSPTQRIGQARRQRGGHLVRQRLVGLGEQLAPLGVAEHHAVDIQLGQHRRRHLAGEGARLRVMHVWANTCTRDPRRVDHRSQRRERRADSDVDAVGRRYPRQQRLDELLGLRDRLMHLPVARHQRRPLTRPPSCVLREPPPPGSFLPSISSSAAPPPVETCVIRSASPNCCSAAAESPPPTTVSPGLRDRLRDRPGAGGERRRTRRRPSARSRRPCRPPRSAGVFRARAGDQRRGPSGRRARRRHRGARAASAPKWSARTRSTGRINFAGPFSSERRSERACSTSSSAHSEAPTAWPWAARNGNAIAPPIRIASATCRKRSITWILSLTLAPPRSATSGRRGHRSARAGCAPRAPAGDRRRALRADWAAPTVEACARWAAPKASST